MQNVNTPPFSRPCLRNRRKRVGGNWAWVESMEDLRNRFYLQLPSIRYIMGIIPHGSLEIGYKKNGRGDYYHIWPWEGVASFGQTAFSSNGTHSRGNPLDHRFMSTNKAQEWLSHVYWFPISFTYTKILLSKCGTTFEQIVISSTQTSLFDGLAPVMHLQVL